MKEYPPGTAFDGIIGRTSNMDDRLVGQADIPVTIPIRMTMGGGVVVGADPGAPVTPDYRSPFEFTGRIYRVDVDVSGELLRDSEAEMRIVMARQ